MGITVRSPFGAVAVENLGRVPAVGLGRMKASPFESVMLKTPSKLPSLDSASLAGPFVSTELPAFRDPVATGTPKIDPIQTAKAERLSVFLDADIVSLPSTNTGVGLETCSGRAPDTVGLGRFGGTGTSVSFGTAGDIKGRGTADLNGAPGREDCFPSAGGTSEGPGFRAGAGCTVSLTPTPLLSDEISGIFTGCVTTGDLSGSIGAAGAGCTSGAAAVVGITKIVVDDVKPPPAPGRISMCPWGKENDIPHSNGAHSPHVVGAANDAPPGRQSPIPG